MAKSSPQEVKTADVILGFALAAIFIATEMFQWGPLVPVFQYVNHLQADLFVYFGEEPGYYRSITFLMVCLPIAIPFGIVKKLRDRHQERQGALAASK